MPRSAGWVRRHRVPSSRPLRRSTRCLIGSIPDERRFPLVPPSAASKPPAGCPALVRSRRPLRWSSTARRPCAGHLDDPGRMPVSGNRHAHALLPGKPHAGQCLPDLRGRAGRRTHAGAGLLPARRAGDGDPHRFAASAAVAQDGDRIPCLIRGSLHGPPGPGIRGTIRRLPRALRAATSSVGAGGARQPRAGPSSPARRDRRGDRRAAGEGG